MIKSFILEKSNNKQDEFIEIIKCGVLKAKGKVLCFFQDSDFIQRNCLEEIFKIIGEDKVCLFVSEYFDFFKKMFSYLKDKCLNINFYPEEEERVNRPLLIIDKETVGKLLGYINNQYRKDREKYRDEISKIAVYNNIKVSVVIPTYNNKYFLELILTSLSNQNFRYEYEVIVCDDGSSDGTKYFVRNFGYIKNLKYLRQKNKGFRAGSARNMGIFNSKGEIIIFLDGDNIPSPNFIEAHYSTHQNSNNKLIVMGCRDEYDGRNTIITPVTVIFNFIFIKNAIKHKDFRMRIYSKYKSNFNSYRYCFLSALTCNLSIKRKILIENSGFNDVFVGWGAEDLELSYRLYLKGMKFIFNKNALSYHPYHFHNDDDYKTARQNELLFYKMYRTRELGEALMLLDNSLVYNEYKHDLKKLFKNAQYLYEKSKSFWEKEY